MNILMFGFCLVIPLITIIVGIHMSKNVPKKINNIWGYRTSMSMKNEETWNFAHKYCGKLWIKLGVFMIIISIITAIISINLSEDILGKVGFILVIVQTVILVVSLFVVEKALKNNFDVYGNKK